MSKIVCRCGKHLDLSGINTISYRANCKVCHVELTFTVTGWVYPAVINAEVVEDKKIEPIPAKGTEQWNADIRSKINEIINYINERGSDE